MNLVHHIHCREDRMALERVFATLFLMETNMKGKFISMYGIIHFYMRWGYTYEDYITNKQIDKPIIKVWSGR